MSALVLALLLSTTPDVPLSETDLELAAVGGFGDRWSVGGLLALNARWHAWGRESINGGLEVSVLVGYQNEPHSFYASNFAPSRETGSNHRTEVFVTVGHGLRIKRFTVGTHFFIGWTQLTLDGRLQNERLGIDRLTTGSGSELTVGAVLHARFRLTDRVSLSGRLFAPVPNINTGINSYLMASLGVGVRF